jgi:hypothetical protein
MELEDRRRKVSVALVAVQHDAVEFSFQEKLREKVLRGEFVFWESWRRASYEGRGVGHRGLEDPFASMMSSFATMLYTFFAGEPSLTEYNLGHGTFLDKYSAEFAQGRRGSKGLWDAMPGHHRVIFAMADDFFGQLCRLRQDPVDDEQLVKSVDEYWRVDTSRDWRRASRGRQPARLFLGLMADCERSLQFEDCLLMLDEETLPALAAFMAGTEALLLSNRTILAPPLSRAADILLEVTEQTFFTEDLRVDLILQFTRMRDESNWAYVERYLLESPGADRIALVVGDFHVSNLALIIARCNADPRDHAIRFTNVCEIGYPFTDEPRTDREARATTQTMLKKMRLWRELSEL